MTSVAYVVNQYPAPSHTFIRREIAALEALGLTIHRFTHRRSVATLTDPADFADLGITEILADAGPKQLVGAACRALFRHPLRFLATLTRAVRMAVRSRQPGLKVHMGYFGLACVLSDRSIRLKVEHVHAHMATNAAAVAMLCHKLCGIPYSFTAHGSYELANPGRSSLGDKVAHADFVVAVSECGLRTLAELFPAKAHRIHLVRCGLDSQWLSQHQSQVPNVGQLVSIARMDSHKDPLLLVRAAAIVRDCGLSFRVLMIGDGPLRVEVEQLIADLGLGHHIQIAGWQTQDEIVEHLRQSRALVLSSRTEGLPVAIMEAFASGRPVIATDVGGVGELVSTGHTGWLVSPGDAIALSKAMRQCLEADSDELQHLAEGGREKVLAQHDVRQSALQLARHFRV